jgi:hypothetical protein
VRDLVPGVVEIEMNGRAVCCHHALGPEWEARVTCVPGAQVSRHNCRPGCGREKAVTCCMWKAR